MSIQDGIMMDAVNEFEGELTPDAASTLNRLHLSLPILELNLYKNYISESVLSSEPNSSKSKFPRSKRDRRPPEFKAKVSCKHLLRFRNIGNILFGLTS